MKFDIFHDVWIDQSHINFGIDGVLQILQIAGDNHEVTGCGNTFQVDEAVNTSFNHNRRQIDAAKLMEEMSKYSTNKFVVLTAHDLFVEGTNFCLGLAIPGKGSIVSSFRAREEIYKTLTMHELMHVFGCVPETRTQNVVESLGLHCTNRCIMRQGMTVQEWAQFTRERMRGNALCPQCEGNLKLASYFSTVFC